MTLVFAPYLWLVAALLVVFIVVLYTVVIWPQRHDSGHAKEIAEAYYTLLRGSGCPPGPRSQNHRHRRPRRRGSPSAT